jgi:MOB kinase activator 1
VYAIIFWNHFKALDKMNAAAHANTALKHFLFFSFEFGLLDKNELKPLEKIVVRLKAEYDALGRKKKTKR